MDQLSGCRGPHPIHRFFMAQLDDTCCTVGHHCDIISSSKAPDGIKLCPVIPSPLAKMQSIPTIICPPFVFDRGRLGKLRSQLCPPLLFFFFFCGSTNKLHNASEPYRFVPCIDQLWLWQTSSNLCHYRSACPLTAAQCKGSRPTQLVTAILGGWVHSQQLCNPNTLQKCKAVQSPSSLAPATAKVGSTASNCVIGSDGLAKTAT